jgi:hypothetical protein
VVASNGGDGCTWFGLFSGRCMVAEIRAEHTERVHETSRWMVEVASGTIRGRIPPSRAADPPVQCSATDSKVPWSQWCTVHGVPPVTHHTDSLVAKPYLPNRPSSRWSNPATNAAMLAQLDTTCTLDLASSGSQSSCGVGMAATASGQSVGESARQPTHVGRRCR